MWMNGLHELDLAKETEHIVDWIKQYFVKNGNENTKAVIGISGGKDSTVCAAACIKALGVDRVIGVLLPNCSNEEEIEDNDVYRESMDVIRALGIKQYCVFNINSTCQEIFKNFETNNFKLDSTNIINTPARIRMTYLYAIAAQIGGRVCNTCNYSENYVGYSTKYGDHAGDFAPIHNYTVREVIEIGKQLGVPDNLINRVPSDGLCGAADEDNLGFTYGALDNYLVNNITPSYDTLRKIEEKHNQNLHKMKRMPNCERKYYLDERYRTF